MALSLFLRSSSRLPVLVSAARLSCVSSAIQPVLLNQHKISNNLVRPISTSQVRLSSSGNHVALWSAERVISLGLLGIVPVSLAFPSQAGDALLALSMVMHAHWGLEAVVTDYVRESIFGSFVPKAAHGLLILFSAATLAGLFMMVYNDVGIATTIRKIWATKPKE